jgi:hypothetical protein
MRLEARYRIDLIKRLQSIFPGCVVLTNDPAWNQGIPDILILFGTQWAMLEIKRSANSPARPNQPYWVDFYDEMSFAAFIYPENEEQVLDALQTTFGASR